MNGAFLLDEAHSLQIGTTAERLAYNQASPAPLPPPPLPLPPPPPPLPPPRQALDNDIAIPILMPRPA